MNNHLNLVNGLIQHVDSATHWRGNIIDFLVTREDENLIRSVSVTEQISDHLMVDFTLTLDKPPRPLKSVTFRKIKDIVRSSYVQDIQSSGLLDVRVDPDIDTLVSGYNDTPRSLTDRHAPEKTRVFVERPRLPYYTAEVDQAKRLRRRLEEKWRTSATPEANELFKSAKLQFQSLFAKAEESYYISKVQESGDDARAIFRIVNNLLHKKKDLFYLHVTHFKILPKILVISSSPRWLRFRRNWWKPVLTAVLSCLVSWSHLALPFWMNFDLSHRQR